MINQEFYQIIRLGDRHWQGLANGMEDDLADLIYEAAFTPDLWSRALGQLADVSGSASGTLLVVRDINTAPVYKSSGYFDDVLTQFYGGEGYFASGRNRLTYDPNLLSLSANGFFSSTDAIPDPDDYLHLFLKNLGLSHQQVSLVPIPTGEVAVFHFERLTRLGRYEPDAVARLTAHRPHLARAGLVAARLRLEAAQATVSALKALAIPAAVVRAGGRVLAANDLLQNKSDLFQSAAFERIVVKDHSANARLVDAVARPDHADVRSIPIAATPERAAHVIHVLPLVRSAQDIFQAGDMLVIAMELGKKTAPASASLLTALFDLTPSEARLAALLMTGVTLKDASETLGVTTSTVRTYLERLFAKTGAHRQTDLINLLRGVAPVGEDCPHA